MLNKPISKNVWGAAGGLEPQRSDLWFVDLRGAVAAISRQGVGSLGLVNTDELHYYATNVTFPERKLKNEEIRQNSLPIQMPSWDEPASGFTITFIHDIANQSRGGVAMSNIYRILETWRMLTRAGRGNFAYPTITNGKEVWLNGNYKVDFKFDIRVQFMKGYVPFEYELPPEGSDALAPQYLDNDLALGPAYTFVNTWLAGFKISDLSYATAGIVNITASFFCDDVQPV